MRDRERQKNINISLEKDRIVCNVGTGLLSIIIEGGDTIARDALWKVENLLNSD